MRSSEIAISSVIHILVEVELWKLKLPELREILKTANLSSTGNKDLLVQRIMQHVESDTNKLRQLLIASNISIPNATGTQYMSPSQELAVGTVPINANSVPLAELAMQSEKMEQTSPIAQAETMAKNPVSRQSNLN